MIKEIKYAGFSAVPSDYESADGQLSASFNVIQEDGALHPISRPAPLLQCVSGGAVRLVHHTASQDNYIIQRGNSLFWMTADDSELSVPSDASAMLVGEFPNISDLTVIGNLIALATDSGLCFLLWKDGIYVNLGSKPPCVGISFGMRQAGTLTDSANLNIRFRRALSGNYVPDEDVEENSNAVYGLLLSSIRDNVTSKGFFYMPFFVRYAFRLHDGSYAWNSAPVLMLPNVIPPHISVGSYEVKDDVAAVPSTLDVPYFSLDYRILNDASSQLANWKDIIAGIDVFVSAPVYTYDQSAAVSRITARRTQLLYAYYDWNPDDIRNPSAPDSVFVGHFMKTGEYGFFDHSESTSSAGGSCWFVPLNKRFHDDVRDVSAFYKIASIGFDDILPSSGLNQDSAFNRLQLDSDDLDTLVSRPVLAEDFRSRCDVIARRLFAFNGRLNLADVNLAPALPASLAESVQATSPAQETELVSISVYSRINECLVCASSASPEHWDLLSSFPRYVFYPDPSAYKMVLSSPSKTVVLKLTTSDFLNGAFWYGSFAADSTPESAEAESASVSAVAPMANKIFTSEVNAPYIFPATGINTVGNGRVLGISAAAKALSQGQFGQFPLYAFTTEGVWALETSASGAYVSRQPVSRDVCINADSITQLDDSVAFATDRGIMLVSGSSLQCVSDSVNSDFPFDNASLPNLLPLLDAAAYPDSALTLEPFSRFLEGCFMSYDYPHQRIFVCNPDYGYAYVLSLKSHCWAVAKVAMVSDVPSYPGALAMSSDDILVDFSSKSASVADGLFITRPLKLDHPDVLKTVVSVIQRGNFRRGHVKSLLFASRDLYTWQLVWSSSDHFLRGFSGSPFKYFRVACISSLCEDESVFGASFEFNLKLTGKLR